MAKQTFTTGQVLTAAQMTSLQETAMGGGPATAKTANYVLVAADAGTTVAMDAAGATTITVNTGLFAAGDTVFIQNLGAGACTVTAGTATVATAGSLILPQNDAGILYFTSASAAIFYDYIQVGATSPLTTKGDLYTFGTSDTRLGVGTDGHTLVADSAQATGLKWAAASSGALVYVGGATFSGSSAVNVNDVFSATYENYLVIGSGITGGSDNVQARFRLRVSGADDTNSVYTTQRLASNDDLSFPGKDSSDSKFRTAAMSTDGTHIQTYFFRPFATAKTGYISMGQGGFTASTYQNAGNFTNTTSFTGFTFYPDSGTASGTFRVYGLANS
jgi:hypothetical protein